MKCVYCHESFYIKRGILDLFKSDKEYICNKCYKKYPLNLRIEHIQLDLYECMVISIFKSRYRIDYNYYFKEVGKIYESLINKKGYTLLFFDMVKLDDSVFEVLDGISKLNKSNLIILTYNIID